MLEILAVVWLCNKNKANAWARGRKSGGFIALTVILWIGMEIIGVIIGYAIGMELTAYLFGLLFALTGGLISYLIAKNCKPGNDASPTTIAVENTMRYAQPLAAPARIDIVRESSFVGSLNSWSFTLNGQYIGVLENGKTITAYTHQSNNAIIAKDIFGAERPPLMFGVLSGGFVELNFKVNRFLPNKSRGLLAPYMPQSVPASPQSASASPQPAPAPPQPAPYMPQSVPVSPQTELVTGTLFCPNCKTALSADSQFCYQCGTRLLGA